MSSGAGWRVHDRQQGGRRSLKRYRRYRSSSAAVADLQPRKPHHDLVGRAGVCRQYRNLSVSAVWRLHLARRQHRRTRRYDFDQRFHAYAIARARRGWPAHRGLSVVFCVRLFVLAGARSFWSAPARSLLADLFHAVLCARRLVVRPRLYRHRAWYHRADADRLFLRSRRRLSVMDGRRERARARTGRPLDAVELARVAEFDEIIHQPLRLRIMAALNTLPPGHGLEFSRLKKLTGATDGNLGAHIETLAKAGYVGVAKAFVGKKPQTTVAATAAGRGAFARHVATLQEIIAASGGDK